MYCVRCWHNGGSLNDFLWVLGKSLSGKRRWEETGKVRVRIRLTLKVLATYIKGML